MGEAQLKATKHRLCAKKKAGQLQEEDHSIFSMADAFQHLHPPLVDPDERWGWQEEQPFAEFLDTGKRLPNTKGTGRFKLGAERPNIALLNLASGMSKERLQRLSLFLHTFLGLTVTTSAATEILRVESSGSKACIIDSQQAVSFPLAVFKSCGLLDVFSVFDVMVEYVATSDYSLLAITDLELGEQVSEPGEPEEVAEVLGRACGDRVAVVQCYKGVTDLELFATVAHELMHTMGFDHTTYWRCLMNPSAYSAEWLFLAPHNLKKLRLFLGQQDDPDFVLRRYHSLQGVWWDVFRKSSDAKRHYEWLQNKIAFLESQSAR